MIVAQPDVWDRLANVATTLGFAAAIFGGFIALLSYRAAIRSADHAHMHALFRDFLRTRFDYALSRRAGGKASTGQKDKDEELPIYSINAQLAGMKLYALEEMWVWVGRQERAFGLRWPLSLTESARRRRDFLNAWRATILAHANQDPKDVAESILNFTPCYTISFLDFVASGWEGNRAAFRAIVAKQKKQARRGGRKVHCRDIADARALAGRIAPPAAAQGQAKTL